MKKNFAAFMSGLVVGIFFGTCLDDDSKKKLRRAFTKQAGKLQKRYKRFVKEGTTRLKRLVEEHLS